MYVLSEGKKKMLLWSNFFPFRYH